MKMVGRPVNIQGTRDWIMFVREHVMGQPYLTLCGKVESRAVRLLTYNIRYGGVGRWRPSRTWSARARRTWWLQEATWPEVVERLARPRA